MQIQDVIIVGAGPSGLAAAIAAKKAGLTYEVLEKAALVNSLLHYPTEMTFFTTPELMEIGGLPFTSPNEKPTRLEALRYYRRVADAYGLDIAFDERVVSIARDERRETFTIESENTRLGGPRQTRHARFVVLATGAYDFPQRLGVPGEDLPHVSHYFITPHPFFRKKVVVVGGKNSAVEAALDLYRAGARVTVVHRGAGIGESVKYWVKPDIENRIKEGTIDARFGASLVEIRPQSVVIERAGAREDLPVDAVFLLTGYMSDNSLLHAAGVELDAHTDGPRHDAESYETNVPGVYVIGAMIAGKASGRIFIENGRFHGQLVIDVIGSRLTAHGFSKTVSRKP
jgi:thioredoxin reductase (NADPH)